MTIEERLKNLEDQLEALLVSFTPEITHEIEERLDDIENEVSIVDAGIPSLDDIEKDIQGIKMEIGLIWGEINGFASDIHDLKEEVELD